MKNKALVTVLALLSVGLLVGCKFKNNNNNSSGGNSSGGSDDYRPYEDGEAKNNNGTGTLFNEVVGYNTQDAAVIEDEGVRYVVYASNETEKGKQVFAARKATREGDKWVYGAKNIVLRGNESGWDKSIFNPSIIKGSFAYQGTTYKYLMAYNGNTGGDTNNHLGLAVTNDILSEWKRVGSKPLLENPEIYEASYGFGSPSLVSYDQLGKGYLFYAVGETEVSFEAVRAYDFSNLDNPKLDPGYTSLPITGLTDKVEGFPVIMNAGFALSNDGKSIYMVRDRLPQSMSKPNQTNEVEIAHADKAILNDLSLSWTVSDNITGFKTMDMEDEESLGWDEIYSGEFVTDGYGRLLNNLTAEVIYSTYDEDANAASYTATLASYEVNL